MNTGKNRVKGLKTVLFKKYQTDPMVKNPTDMLGIPDLTQSNNTGVNYQSTPYDYSTPQETPDFKRPDPKGFKAFTIDEKAEKAREETTVITPPQDWRDYVRAGVGAVSNIKGVQEDAQGRMDLAEKVQNLNDQPRYMPNEYQYMARPGSQSVIFARHGAEIRTGTQTGAEEAELEQGEMFMLPNLDSYVVGGKKHSAGGEKFVLPQGTIGIRLTT